MIQSLVYPIDWAPSRRRFHGLVSSHEQPHRVGFGLGWYSAEGGTLACGGIIVHAVNNSAYLCMVQLLQKYCYSTVHLMLQTALILK